jgi:hypothetical protein
MRVRWFSSPFDMVNARRGTIEKQLDNQISHIDSLDTKAGTLFGFLAVTLATGAGTKDFVEAAKSYNALKSRWPPSSSPSS